MLGVKWCNQKVLARERERERERERVSFFLNMPTKFCVHSYSSRSEIGFFTPGR
jgi:hypothetical protein